MIERHKGEVMVANLEGRSYIGVHDGSLSKDLETCVFHGPIKFGANLSTGIS